MEIKSNTYYVLFCRKDFSKTLIKGSQIIEYTKRANRPMFEVLNNFEVTLATKTQILLFARKDQLNDSI